MCVPSLGGKSLASGKFVPEIRHFELWRHSSLLAYICYILQLTAAVCVEGNSRSKAAISIKKRSAVSLCSWRVHVLRTMEYQCTSYPQTRLASKWSKAIHVHRADWTGPSSFSRLYSLHFTSDCYDRFLLLRFFTKTHIAYNLILSW